MIYINTKNCHPEMTVPLNLSNSKKFIYSTLWKVYEFACAVGIITISFIFT